VKSGAQWILGQKMTQADAAAAKMMGALKPSPATHPNLFSWAAMVTKFTEAVSGKWAAGDLPLPAGSAKEESKEEVAKPVATTAATAAAEDEFDPFAEDAEGDAAAAEALKAKGAAAKSAKVKVPVTAKSIIVWEVKPWGEETDLDALAAKILAIQMDGLFWKTEYKKEPIAYGVSKIIIGAVVEDAKVSTDDVQDAIEAFEDDVQSIDIQSFNKL